MLSPQSADGLDGSVVGGGDVDEVDPVRQVACGLMAEEEFNGRAGSGFVIA